MSEEKPNIDTLKPKLFIVDDDKHILEAFTLLFEDEYEVETCSVLKEAVDQVTNNEIDVILLDVELGHDNGMDLLPVIKSKQNRTEVIMISAHEKSYYIVPSMYHGARQYLPKPIDREVLQAEVENALWDKRHKKKETMDIRVNREIAEDLDEREVMAFKLSYIRTTDIEIAKI